MWTKLTSILSPVNKNSPTLLQPRNTTLGVQTMCPNWVEQGYILFNYLVGGSIPCPSSSRAWLQKRLHLLLDFISDDYIPFNVCVELLTIICFRDFGDWAFSYLSFTTQLRGIDHLAKRHLGIHSITNTITRRGGFTHSVVLRRHRDTERNPS